MEGAMEKEQAQKRKYSWKETAKFLLCSGFGCFMFLFPVSGGQSDFNTTLSVLTEMLDKAIQANLPWLLTAIVVFSSVGALVGQFWKPAFVRKYEWLSELLFVSKPYMVTRLVALFVTLCVVLGVGPEAVRSADVGESMVGLSQTLVALAVTLSFVLPFLTDCGIMEFTGILLKPLIRPLFHVPGRASVDLIASWLASSNTAVLITGNQYNSGFYSKREAASIMTNFSLVSIPFCMVVAETLHVTSHFLLLYGSVTIIGLILAAIGVRIRPLVSIPDTFHGEKKINEEVPKDASLVRWAWTEALGRAAKFRLAEALKAGGKMTIGIVLDLIPIVIAWGTIGTLLVNETSIMQWISYPMGAYMSLMGIEGAFQIAPATLVGFIDMFIPALITSPDLPETTRFLVAGLSLVQIIYLTEVGSIIVKSGVGLDFKKLFLIFLERTIIAIPLFVMVTKLL